MFDPLISAKDKWPAWFLIQSLPGQKWDLFCFHCPIGVIVREPTRSSPLWQLAICHRVSGLRHNKLHIEWLPFFCLCYFALSRDRIQSKWSCQTVSLNPLDGQTTHNRLCRWRNSWLAPKGRSRLISWGSVWMCWEGFNTSALEVATYLKEISQSNKYALWQHLLNTKQLWGRLKRYIPA